MENIKVAKKLTKNSIMLIIGQILTKIIGLVFIIILARTLGINDFGKYSFILNTVLLISVFVNFGLDTLLVREIATDKTNLSNYFGNIIWIKILISAVLISIIYIITNVTNLLNDPVKSYGLMLFSFIIFFTTLNTTFWTIGDANQEMQYHSILSILWSILRFVFGLIVILINNNLISLLRILLLSEIIIAIISFFVITRKFGTPKLFPDKKISH